MVREQMPAGWRLLGPSHPTWSSLLELLPELTRLADTA
jgi:hypothetical protein